MAIVAGNAIRKETVQIIRLNGIYSFGLALSSLVLNKLTFKNAIIKKIKVFKTTFLKLT